MSNLDKLDQTAMDFRHIGCVRFSSGETIKHKLAKCVSGILASEGVAVEDIQEFVAKEGAVFDFKRLALDLLLCRNDYATEDNQQYIQEARFKEGRRVDHWQIALDKRLEFETDIKVDKLDSITVRL